MYEFIEGEIIEINPTYIIIKSGGIGYFINITLTSYTILSNKKEAKLYVHQVVREDAHLLFGFFQKDEREIFRQLISVSGIGANTARMMLSSLSSSEIQQAILESDVSLLKSIKGVGLKTAQRLIVDLKDKLGKIETHADLFPSKGNTNRNEALSALVMLGFPKNNVTKVLDQLSKTLNLQETTVEEIVKQALKKL